jgi:hypothetical protein
MTMEDRQCERPAADVCDPPRSAARSAALHDDAVASVIGHARRLIASSLTPVGRGLDADDDQTRDSAGGLIQAAIQIDAVTALYRRLSQPPPEGSLDEHCRALCCDVVLALGRLKVTPRVAMCAAPLSPDQAVCLAVLVVELVSNRLGRAAASQDGTVWVGLKPLRDGRLELSISDSLDLPMSDRSRLLGRVEALVQALPGELVGGGGHPAGSVRVRFAAA